MNKCFRIIWPGTRTIERFTAPLGPQPQANEVPQTTEYYIDEDKFFDAVTTSIRTVDPDGKQRLTIRHAIENYPEGLLRELSQEFGQPGNWLWGTATIIISPDLDSAKAVWKDDSHTEYDGQGQCTILSQELFQAHEREVVSRIKREQEQFKEELAPDRCCIITGEVTKRVLDAAHIIDAALGGNEIPSNGILLRADIHRLYDARCFEISYRDGTIEKISDCISEAYKRILKGKKLNEIIFARVQAALAERARLNQGG